HVAWCATQSRCLVRYSTIAVARNVSANAWEADGAPSWMSRPIRTATVEAGNLSEDPYGLAAHVKGVLARGRWRRLRRACNQIQPEDSAHVPVVREHHRQIFGQG